LTQFELGGIALGSLEAGVTQDKHLCCALANPPLKGVLGDIGGGTCPPHAQPPLIEQETECPADNPAVIREAFATNLLRPAAFTHRMDARKPIRVDDAEHRRSGQEDLRPVVMRREETQEPGALGEPGKQRPIVACQPAREGSVADALVGRRKARYLLEQGTSPHAPR
jgi:hypothetical protein